MPAGLAHNHPVSRKSGGGDFGCFPLFSIVTDPEKTCSPQTTHLSSSLGAWHSLGTAPLRGDGWLRVAGTDFRAAAACGFTRDERHPEQTPKHSFRLIFKRRYGSAQCIFQLFGARLRATSTSLILRAGGSDSWLTARRAPPPGRLHPRRVDAEEPARHGLSSPLSASLCIIPQWLYWGLYTCASRPGAAFACLATKPISAPEFDPIKAAKSSPATRSPGPR